MKLKALILSIALAACLHAQSLGNQTVTVSGATPILTVTAGYTTFVWTLSANVASSTFSSPAVGDGALILCENGTGGYTVAYPANFVGFPALASTAANYCERYTWHYDGTNVTATGENRVQSDGSTTLPGTLKIGTTFLGPKTIGVGANQLPSAASSTRAITEVTDALNVNDCTIGGGTAIAVCYSNGVVWGSLGGSPPASVCQPTSYTTLYTDAAFIVASTTATSNLVTLSAGQRLCGAVFTPLISYAGTSIAAITCSLGTPTSGNASIYASALSAMQTSQTFGIGGNFIAADLGTPDSSLVVRLTCTATGANFGNGSATVLTAGSWKTTVYVTTVP